MCGGFPTPTNSLALQTQLSVLQFNSDTNYPELIKFHRFKDLGLETALTSDASHKTWVPRILMLLSNLATKSKVFHNPHPRLDNLLE